MSDAAGARPMLAGHGIRLEPLSAAHLPGLAAAIEDGALWELPVTIVPHPRDLPQFLANAEAGMAAGTELVFATIDAASGAVVGSTRFLRIDHPHRRVEIGFTFIAASRQRSHVNTAAKLLMLAHAFEQWGFNRVELMTDVRNERSRAAILRLGARPEGVLRKHMIMRDGHVRDSMLFSLTSGDWPAVRRGLEAKLARTPDWEGRLETLWASLDAREPAGFVAALDALAAELPPGDAIALFERAGARDSTGRTDEAVPLYRAALAAGLTGLRRRRATIQLASSLRALGDAAQAAALLEAEIAAGDSDELDDALRAFLALALVDLGREREAVGLGLTALARHLPRYQRSLARYAAGIGAGSRSDDER